ncbi:MAG: hypothetical protein ACMXYB_01010 [Candidatus Woesearchaeota archaeon]
MAIDFEEFLNKALSTNTKKDDIFDLDLEEDEKTTKELETISIQPLLEQISKLKQKALETPQKFKEIYQKFEEFEKNYPLYFIDIQSSLYENQSLLKSKYLSEILEKENKKLVDIRKFFETELELISQHIDEKKFKNAHDRINSINYEILQIPKSYTDLKIEFNTKIQKIISTYYFELERSKKKLAFLYIDVMKLILNQKTLIFTTIYRDELDELIQDIHTLFLKKRIELDMYLSRYISKFILFTNKLIEYRKQIQIKTEQEFKKYFSYLEQEFKKSIQKNKTYQALIILEVAHLLLKKETIYNQELKISYFLKLIELKKDINTLSYNTRKGFSEEELTLCYAYSKFNLINLIQNSIIRYNKNEIKSIIKEISNLENISIKHKKILISKLEAKININLTKN